MLDPRNIKEGYKFYVQDCIRVGQEPDPKPNPERMPYKTSDIPDVTKIKTCIPGEFDRDTEGCYKLDPKVCNIRAKVVNIAWYFKNGDKLIEDIERFKPDVLMLSWCFSMNGSVPMLFRRTGLFSYMILRHDLRLITENPKAELNKQQKKIISHIGKEKNNIHLHHYFLVKRIKKD